MYTEADSLNSVGLRHVIEDGLSILRGSPIDDARRNYVLEDLSTLVSEAKHCSDMVQGQNWFATSPNREAYEFFSLMERYLSETGKPWREWLESASLVFEQISQHQQVNDANRIQGAISLLEELLACLASRPRIPTPTSPFDNRLGLQP